MKKDENSFKNTIEEIDEEMKSRTIGLNKAKIYTIKEAAQLLEIDSKDILKLILERKISHVKAGTKIMLRDKDISDVIGLLKKEFVPKPVLYTVKQVSEILQLTKRNVVYLLNSRELKGFKITDKERSPWRVREEDLKEFIEKRIKEKQKELAKRVR